MSIQFQQVAVGPMQNFAYVFGKDGKGVIVDPGFEGERLVKEAESLGLDVETILLTHGHHDHIGDVPRVRELTGARVVAHPESPVKPDVPVTDGQELELAGLPVKAVHTPGHEPTSVCFVVADQWLLTGDTLFINECGRADLPGSDPAALWDSLLNRLKSLPGHLVVAPGHDYGPKRTDTLENQFQSNYTLKPRTKDEFVAFVLA